MRKNVGAFGMIFGLLFLALEIYGFRILQALEKLHGQWRTNPWGYACEPPCAFSLVLTIAVIFFSVHLFFAEK